MQLMHWPLVLHFIQLTVDKYDAEWQLHKCSYALKSKILLQKMPLYDFLSDIYITQAGRAVFSTLEFKCDFIQQFSKYKINLYYIWNILSVFAQFCREHIT